MPPGAAADVRSECSTAPELRRGGRSERRRYGDSTRRQSQIDEEAIELNVQSEAVTNAAPNDASTGRSMCDVASHAAIQFL